METSLDYERTTPITFKPKFKVDSVLNNSVAIVENCIAIAESYTTF